MTVRGRRRWPLIAAAVAVLALVAGGMVAVNRANGTYDAAPDRYHLHARGIQVGPDGEVSVVPVGTASAYVPGSRVWEPPAEAGSAQGDAALEAADHQQEWLAEGTVPDAGYAEMVSGALLDIHSLTLAPGATVAGWTQSWRYVWPRDSSFVAAAMAATGHVEEAVDAFDFLQRVQGADGTFEARYLPDGSGPPDDRSPQTDGAGWVMWALGYTVDAVSEAGGEEGAAAAEEIRDRFAQLIARSTDFLIGQVGDDGLPEPSPDYWEVHEDELTLGTAAPVLAGLEAARGLVPEGQRERVDDAAAQARAGIEATFGESGYGRYHNDPAADAASAFVLPPFQPEALPGAAESWQGSIEAMRRPGGGLAPGAAWREQTISWTPQTALYGWSAAVNGDEAHAREFMDWISEHRTDLGAIPEKVRPDGSPAGVAPLCWTSALVVLTAAELDSGADG